MQHASIQLVWLKRDLRLDDHRPIFEACQTGATMVLYVFEPELWAMPEMDRSHFDFIMESLQDLSSRLCKIGGRLAIRVGELPEVFIAITKNADIAGLCSHEETGNGFEAWAAGITGYPMIDACMRALHETSWINFRMRAMLMSFASNHLWLHWRPTAVLLAKHFLDFEPGIHFSQCQMQSGTTGINTIRIYSPAKQVIDHDPTGLLIRKYVPALARVPDKYLPEPHRMPMDVQSQVGCILGRDYPLPIVDHRKAYKSAQEKIFAIGQTASAIEESKRVFVKHGSRKRRDPLPKPKKASGFRQLSLFDDVQDPS